MIHPDVLLVLIKTQEELGEVGCVLLEAVIPHDHEVTPQLPAACSRVLKTHALFPVDKEN